MRRRLLLLPLVLLVCSGDDDVGTAATTTESTAGTTTSSTTTTEATTTTTAFVGDTTPTSAPGTASRVALLTDVAVDGTSVTFTFEDDGTPGFDAAFVDPPILEDASGREVDVDGDAHLSVHMEPASGVDLGGEEFRETYAGPDRISGPGPIAEVVKTGDFEANLTWVIGLDRERPFRIDVGPRTITVRFDPS